MMTAHLARNSFDLTPEIEDLMKRMFHILLLAKLLANDNRDASHPLTLPMLDGTTTHVVDKDDKLCLTWRPKGCDKDSTLVVEQPSVRLEVSTRTGERYALTLHDELEMVTAWNIGSGYAVEIPEGDPRLAWLYDALPRPLSL